MSESPLIALVVGGTGVVGRYIIKHLASPASRFQLCYSCSRRPADVGDSSLSPKLRSIQVDLLKLQNSESDGAEEGRVNLGRLGVTHLFFAGYAGSVEVAPNLAMLENALSALDGPTLRHVHLVEGTKWYGYGVLPGPFKNPAKESDPRCLIDLFYYHQQDLLESCVARADCQWTWSASRPHAVVGFSVGSAMNIVLAVAVYAAVCKELGIPLHFPGTQATFDAVYQMTDSTLLARGIEHLSTQPQVNSITPIQIIQMCMQNDTVSAVRESSGQHHQRRLHPLAQRVAARCSCFWHGVRHRAHDEADRGHEHPGQGALVAAPG